MKMILTLLALGAVGTLSLPDCALAGPSTDNNSVAHPHYQNQCGTFALSRFLGEAAAGWPDVLRIPPPRGGFSLRELSDLSAGLGVELVPARRIEGSELPVPSIVHLSQGHYITLTRKEGLLFETWDASTPQTSRWRSANEINQGASGFFLTTLFRSCCDINTRILRLIGLTKVKPRRVFKYPNRLP